MTISVSDEAIDPTRYAWPDVAFDAVDQMRLLASSLPHAAANEIIFDADFDRVWSFVSDLENATPQYEASVSDARIIRRTAAPGGEQIELLARSPWPVSWVKFDVVLRPGWCLMRSRLGDVGMAARAEGTHQTRFFHFEGSQLMGQTLGRLVKPLFAWNIRQDFRKLRELI